MADRKGIFTVDQEKAICRFLDYKIVLRNKHLLELVDYHVFRGLLAIADNYGAENINIDFKKSLQKLADSLINENYEQTGIIIDDLSVLLTEPLLEYDNIDVFKNIILLIISLIKEAL